MSKPFPELPDVGAECAKLGITPGRSLAETLKRIEDRRAAGSTIGSTINAAFAEAVAVQFNELAEIPAAVWAAIKPEIRPIDPVALEANWKRMEAAKARMAQPCHNRFPLLASTALCTRDGLASYSPVYRGMPKKSFDDIAAELRATMSGRFR